MQMTLAGVAFANQDYEFPKTLNVGFFKYNGYHEVNEFGIRSGYGYDYLHEISKSTNWKYNYVDCGWEQCVKMLEEGRLDILTSAQKTPEREEKFDFSELPMGINYVHLAARKDETRFKRNDFTSFNGITIGTLADSTRNNDLRRLAEKNNFTYIEKQYDNAQLLENALRNKQVDAIVTSSLRIPREEIVIARFAPSQFYCMVKKGNTKLLSALNEAINFLHLKNPQFAAFLQEKYYGPHASQNIQKSAEELSLLHDYDVMRVVGAEDAYPLYEYDGKSEKARGISVDILESIAQRLGIKLEYVYAKNHDDALQIVSRGDADILAYVNCDFNLAEHLDLRITSAYTPLTYSTITHINFKNEVKNIGVLRGSFLGKDVLQKLYPDKNVFSYFTVQEVVEAVNKNVVEMGVLNTFFAQHAVFPNFPSLKTTLISIHTDNIAFGVNAHIPLLLYTLLEREVLALEPAFIAKTIAEYTFEGTHTVTFMQYVKLHPVLFITIFIAVAVAVIMILLYIMRVRKKHAEKVYTLAYYDALTGLFSANGFEYAVKKHVKKMKPTHCIALLAIDIENFSRVNGDYGRPIGDKLIVKVAEYLRDVLYTDAIIARGYADNFFACIFYSDNRRYGRLIRSILLPKMVYLDSDTMVMQKLRVGGCQETNIFAFNFHNSLDCATLAHQWAKAKVKSYINYDKRLQDQLQFNKSIVDYFEFAMKSGEFQVYYQPKNDMRNEEIVGAEALIRWNHAQHGFVPPSVFIPLLEASGDVIEVDFFVLEEVCKLMQYWMNAGRKILPISVNQSKVNFRHSTYMNRLKNLVEKYAIPENVIELEITETLFESNGLTKEIIIEMRKLGFAISLDDFGTGYSSLSMLSQLDLDTMKIDKSLVDDSEKAPTARTILSNIVSMAHELGLKVVCEGVEKVEQVDFLLQIGCTYAQGYLYSKPLPKQYFLQLLPQEPLKVK